MLQEVVKQEPEEPSLDSLSKGVTSAKAPIRATAVQKRELLQFFDGGHYRNSEELQEASERIGLSVAWIQSWMTRTRVAKGLARTRKANGKQDSPKEVIKIEDDEPVSAVLLQGSISQGPPAKRRRKRVVSSYHVPTDIIDVDKPPSKPSVKTAPPQIRLTIRLPARPAASVNPSLGIPPKTNAPSLPQSISAPTSIPTNAPISSVDHSSLLIPPPPLVAVPTLLSQLSEPGAISHSRTSDQTSASGRPVALGPATVSIPAARSAPTIRIPASASLSSSNLVKTAASTSAHTNANIKSGSRSHVRPPDAIVRGSSSASSLEPCQTMSTRNPEYTTSRCRVVKRSRTAGPTISSRRSHPGLLTDHDTLTIYTPLDLPAASKRRNQPKKNKQLPTKSKSSKQKAPKQEMTNGHDGSSGSASKDASPNDSDSSSDGSSSDSDGASVLDGISNKSTAPPSPPLTNGAATGLPPQPVPANAPPHQALPPPIRPLSAATNDTWDLTEDRQYPLTPLPPQPSKTPRPRASLNVTFSEAPTIMPNKVPELQDATPTPHLSQPTFTTLTNVPAKRIYPLTAVPHADEPMPLPAPHPPPPAKPIPSPIEETSTPVYQGIHTFMFDPDLPAKTQEELNASIRVTKRQPENDFARLLRAKIDPYDMNRTSFRRVSIPSSVSSRGLS